MKKRALHAQSPFVILLACALGWSGLSRAATYYWETIPNTVTGGDDFRDGGSGTWDVTTANFTTSATDATTVNHNLWSAALNNAGTDAVIFGGASGGTITLAPFTSGGQLTNSTSVGFTSLTFDTDGYVLSGTNNIRFIGTAGTITVKPGVTAAILNPINSAGVTGYTVDTSIEINGGGVLRLGGGNGSQGFTIVTGTTVEVSGGSFSGFNQSTVNGTLRMTGNNVLPGPSSLTGVTGLLDINGTTQTTGTVTGALNVSNTDSTGDATLNLSLVASAGVHTGVISNGTGKISLAVTGAFGQGNGFNTSITYATQTFAGANTFTGSTSLGRGSVVLDFSNATAPVSDIFYNSGFGATPIGDDGLLVISKPTQTINTAPDSAIGSLATLTLTGKASTTNSQRFNGFRLNPNSAASIFLNPNATANTVTLTLGEITRNPGSAVNFATTSGTTALSANAFVKSTSGTADTILTDSTGVAFATLGGRDWAGKNAANDTLAPALYTNATTTTLSGNATTLTAGGGANDTRLAADTTISSLRFANSTTRSTIGLGGKTLTTGGILVSNVVANSGTWIGDGLLTSVGTDLTIFNFAGTSRWFSVDATITETPFGIMGLTVFGTTPVQLSRDNSYTGTLNVQQNALILTGSNSPAAVNINGNITNAAGSQLPGNAPTSTLLQLGSASATGSIGDTAPINIGPNAIVAVKRTDDITFLNPTRGLGGFTQGWSGTTTLISEPAAKYFHVGDTTVTAGTLKLDYTIANVGIINDSSRLVLGGGTVLHATDTSTAHNEAVRDTVLISGASSIIKSGDGTGRLRLNTLNTQENAGGTLTFSASGIADTDTSNTNGILGSRARFLLSSGGSQDWAVSVASGAADAPITAFANYGTLATTAGTDALNPLQTLTSGLAFTGSRTTNTLKLANTSGSGQTVDLAAGNTLTLTAGGLLVTGADAVSLTNGTLKSNTAANSDLIIHQHNTGGLTIGSVIANGIGNSTVTKSGPGVLTLSGNNTYTGDNHVTGGTLSVSANENLGLSAGGTVTVLTSSTTSPTVTLSSATLPPGFQIGTNLLGRQVSAITGDTVTLNGNANLTITTSTASNYTIGANLVLNNGTLRATSTFSLATGLGGTSRNRNITLNGIGGTINVDGTHTLTHPGTLTGPGGLTKTGAGTLEIRQGGHSGPTSILNGTLKYGAAVNNVYTSLTVGAAGTLDIGGFGNAIGALSGSGTVTNTGAAATLTFGALPESTSFSGVFTNGATALNLDKYGPATFTLTSGAHSYTGTTTVSGGKLILTGDGALPDTTLVNTTSINSLVDFSAITATGEAIGSLGGVAGSSVLMGTKDLTIAGTGANNFAGVLSGTGTVTVLRSAAATQTFSGPNTYTGVTRITQGVLTASHNNALGTLDGNTIIHSTGSVTVPGAVAGVNTAFGGQLLLSGGVTLAENILIEGTGDATNFQKAISSQTGTNTLTGTITVTGTTSYRIGAINGTLNTGLIQRSTASGGVLVFDPSVGAVLNIGTALDNNGGGITCHAGGLVVFQAAANDIGAVTVQNGTSLRIGVSEALAPDRNLTLGQASATNGATGLNNDVGTFDLAGQNQTINALIGFPNAGTLVPPATNNATTADRRLITSSTAGNSLLTLGNGGGSGTFNGTVQNGSGVVSLIKTGAGTQTLTGVLSHTGDTTINGGVLSLGATTDLPDPGTVRIAGVGSFLTLADGVNDTVAALFIDGQPVTGTWGSSASAAANQDDNHFTGTGILTVATADPYTTWATTLGLQNPWLGVNPQLNGAAAADPDGDGRTNRSEFAFGQNPTVGSGSEITVPLDKTTGLFSYTRRQPGLTGLSYTYQWSSSLTGLWTTFAPTSAVSNAGTPVEVVTARVPAAIITANPGRFFVRVLVP